MSVRRLALSSSLLRPAILAAALTSTPVAAQNTATGTIAVSALVLPSCHVEAGALAFGANYGRTTTAQAPVMLSCTPGTAYAVSLDQGQHGERRLAQQSGAGFVDYEIFQDAAATTVWSSVARGGAVSGIAPGSGRMTLTAYGKLEGGLATPGRYADVVTLTVQF